MLFQPAHTSVRDRTTVVDEHFADAHRESVLSVAEAIILCVISIRGLLPLLLENTRSHHSKRFNMRLSSSPAAVCVAASFCLAATTTEAFLVPSAALRGAPLTRGQRATCSRCVGPAAVKMATMKGDASNPSQPDTPRRATFLSTAGGLLARRRGTVPAPNASEGGATGPGQVARGGRRQRRAREVARRGFAAVATAVIVRSAFRAQPASAIMPKLRGSTAQQKVRAMHACHIMWRPGNELVGPLPSGASCHLCPAYRAFCCHFVVCESVASSGFALYSPHLYIYTPCSYLMCLIYRRTWYIRYS